MLGTREAAKVVHGALELMKGDSWRECNLAASGLDGAALVRVVSRTLHRDGGVDGGAEAVRNNEELRSMIAIVQRGHPALTTTASR